MNPLPGAVGIGIILVSLLTAKLHPTASSNQKTRKDVPGTLMHLVPAPAVRLMKRRVSSRPGVYSLMSRETPGLILPQHSMKREGKVLRVFSSGRWLIDGPMNGSFFAQGSNFRIIALLEP